ncbi:hypothetical protein E2562_007065 [Oryza meyeriana var. granulata]|uniref:Uncharacterized protein n=1 Tax=Oryza meyeriana var. granulata TaxID=110450 RepID=A0A6G1F4M7_9ORYZ|nr:hypothetical protein E2562_007065 [Oryza meyeriana var. granulata]
MGFDNEHQTVKDVEIGSGEEGRRIMIDAADLEVDVIDESMVVLVAAGRGGVMAASSPRSDDNGR